MVTEFWAEQNLYCPNCTSPSLGRLKHNTRASDFSCPNCKFWFQLKGQKSRIGNSVTDGAYAAMMQAIRNDETPNFYFLHYDLATWTIKNLLLIPSFAFPPSAIIKRPPLAATARRAGWIGCNIALNRVPVEAQIAIVTTVAVPSPLRSGGEGKGEEAQSLVSELGKPGKGEVARLKSPLSGSLPVGEREMSQGERYFSPSPLRGEG